MRIQLPTPPQSPAETIELCQDLIRLIRRNLFHEMAPDNEPHAMLNRTKRDYPDAYADDINDIMQLQTDKMAPAELEQAADAALHTMVNNGIYASAIGTKAMVNGMKLPPAKPRPASQQPPPAGPQPFMPFTPSTDRGQYAYVPHNPNADMATDDMVAFPWRKRTLYKPAGLLVYFTYREKEHHEYWTANGCVIQGQWRPVQPISEDKAVKLSSGSNVDAARDSHHQREFFLRGGHDHRRVFPPWYGRPKNQKPTAGFYLCNSCKTALTKQADGSMTCPNGCHRP